MFCCLWSVCVLSLALSLSLSGPFLLLSLAFLLFVSALLPAVLCLVSLLVACVAIALAAVSSRLAFYFVSLWSLGLFVFALALSASFLVFPLFASALVPRLLLVCCKRHTIQTKLPWRNATAATHKLLVIVK